MKLLYCLECGDVFSLRLDNYYRNCVCGKSKGKYIDSLNAIYSGPCIPLGFNNNSFTYALSNQPNEGDGKRFEAFIIPKECSTFIKED